MLYCDLMTRRWFAKGRGFGLDLFWKQSRLARFHAPASIGNATGCCAATQLPVEMGGLSYSTLTQLQTSCC